MKLTKIRDGEIIVLDTNILVYANQQKSKQCVQLLGRCARKEVQGVVSMPVVAELMHTLMLIEARENGWIRGTNPSRTLSEKPDRVRRLTNYERQMREFFAIGLRLEPVSSLDVLEAMNIQREFGLLTNDSIIVAAARRLNCTTIASADRAFASLKKFDVYSPSDLQD
jgi:predicted nucleic acid-binding protein